jgi:hypothetical protein
MSGAVNYYFMLFHGTNNIYSDNIFKYGFQLQEETRDDHWLGNGIYFFREDLEQAYNWAFYKFKDCQETNEVVVLHTVVEIQGNNVLNLDSRGGMMVMKRFTEELKRKLRGIKFNHSNPAKIRHFIMKLLPSEYSIIQRTFPAEKSLFDDIPMFQQMGLRLNGTQVCVRDPAVITKDISIVKRRVIKRNLAKS